MAQIHHGGGHPGSSRASINAICGGAPQRAIGKRVTGAWAPSAVNLTQSRAQPPPRRANGALIARTTSWVGRNVGCRRAVGGGAPQREPGTQSIIHVLPSSATNEPELIADTFLKTGISRRFWRRLPGESLSGGAEICIRAPAGLAAVTCWETPAWLSTNIRGCKAGSLLRSPA